MTKSTRVVVVALLMAGLVNAPACSGSSQSSGSKSNWLEPCRVDGDCAEGSCLCGFCTTTCGDSMACQMDGARCARTDSASLTGLCALGVPSSAEGICVASALLSDAAMGGDAVPDSGPSHEDAAVDGARESSEEDGGRTEGGTTAGGTTDGGGAVIPPRSATRIAAEAFARQLGELSCGYLSGCLSNHTDGISDKVQPFYAADALRAPAACPAAMGDMFVDTLATIGRAMDRGTVRFDAAAAAGCLEEARATCYPPFAWAINESSDDRWVLCPEAFVGDATNGAPCSIDEQCQEGSYCDADEGTCPGACAPRLAPGSDCEASPEACGGELPRCGGGRDFAVCIERLLDPALAELGQACDVIETVGTRERWRSCELGLACVAGTCVTPARVGGPCGEEAMCAPGLGCGPSNTCIEVPAHEVGSPCSGQLCGILPMLFCDQGTCVDAAGFGWCHSSATCPAGQECIDEQCNPILGAGEECFQDEQCRSGLCRNRPLPGGGLEEPARCCGG